MADPPFCTAIMANIPIASDAETKDLTGTFLKLSDCPADFQAHFNAARWVRRNDKRSLADQTLTQERGSGERKLVLTPTVALLTVTPGAPRRREAYHPVAEKCCSVQEWLSRQNGSSRLSRPVYT